MSWTPNLDLSNPETALYADVRDRVARAIVERFPPRAHPDNDDFAEALNYAEAALAAVGVVASEARAKRNDPEDPAASTVICTGAYQDVHEAFVRADPTVTFELRPVIYGRWEPESAPSDRGVR